MLMGSVLRLHHLLWSESRRHCRRSFSSSSFSSCSSTTPSPSSTPSDPILGNPTPGKMSRFLKFGFFGAVAGVLGSAGYATYVYTADEVDDMTKAFRTSIDRTKAVDAASNIEVVSCTSPAKAVDIYLNLRRSVEGCLKEFAEPSSNKLLSDMDPTLQQLGICTLVLDLRDTLIHTEWKHETGWSTFKRPGLDAFLEQLSQFYEIIVYTDEINVDHLREKFAQKGVTYILARSDTKYQDGKHYRTSPS